MDFSRKETGGGVVGTEFPGVTEKNSCGISRFFAFKFTKYVAQICNIFSSEALFCVEVP